MRSEISEARTFKLSVHPPPSSALRGDGITLRLPTAADARVLAEYGADVVLLDGHWVGLPPENLDITLWARSCVTEWSEGWTQEGSLSGPALIVDSQQPFVGVVNLLPRYQSVIELLYSTLPTVRGRGIASRALRTAAAWLLDGDQFSRIELRIEDQHLISRRVAENAGFRYVESIETFVATTGQSHIDCLYIKERKR